MAHCYNCNTTVVSLTRHDFNCCKCEETTEGLGLLECLFGSTFIELSDYNPIEVEILESVGLIRKVGTIAVATTLLKRINKYGNYFTKIHL